MWYLLNIDVSVFRPNKIEIVYATRNICKESLKYGANFTHFYTIFISSENMCKDTTGFWNWCGDSVLILLTDQRPRIWMPSIQAIYLLCHVVGCQTWYKENCWLRKKINDYSFWLYFFSHPNIEYGTYNDILVWPLPFYHIFGISSIFCYTLYKGGTTVVIHKFQLEEYLKVVQKYKVCTHSCHSQVNRPNIKEAEICQSRTNIFVLHVGQLQKLVKIYH